MKKNWISILVLLILAVNTAFLISLYTSKPKLGYVKSQELVYGYMGMKEAQSKFQMKQNSLQSNIDTLKAEFQMAISKYNNDFSELSDAEKQSREERLRIQEMNINKYAQNIEGELADEEAEMLSGVLNQVNSFIEEYGKDKGYEMIFGTTSDGSLLYGEQGQDLTEEVLEAMNKNYSGL